jgi:putative ABC transport system substrate-binding protein
MHFHRWKRREFITLLGGAVVASPLAARAQQSVKIPRIGIIDDAPIWDHFRRGLRDAGYLERQNIAFEYRLAGGQPERLAAAAKQLAALPVDIIVTSGTAATRAAQQATGTIPIVMIAIGDPVRAGVVPNLARPGGNITGNSMLGAEMTPKRAQLLKQLIPQLSRLAFLWNRNNASHLAYLDEWRAAVPKVDAQLLFIEVSRDEEFEPAFERMMQERADALSITADPFHLSHIAWIIDFVAKHRLPTMYVLKENVAAGGLMSYGPSIPDLYRRAAGYVHKILQGTSPAELPVEQPAKFELAINARTARAIDLAVPPMLLALADEVIE